jgi:hypothetical protein
MLMIAIQMILHAESIRCRWQLIQRAANPTRGGTVTWLTVPHPAGDILYSTREGVESQGAAAIKMWYKVAWGAPILQDAQLQGNFGFLANTVLADWQIRSCRAHISTPRTWIHIPSSCYRRQDTSSTDS